MPMLRSTTPARLGSRPPRWPGAWRRAVGWAMGTAAWLAPLGHAQSGPATPPTPTALRVEVLAQGLVHPWGLAFIDSGHMLVTERPGRLRRVSAQGEVGPPIAGVPVVDAGGQGGLLDVQADRDFARNRRVYLCYAEPDPQGRGNSTALGVGRLSDDGARLERWQVLFRQSPKVDSRAHFGCRIAESPDGHLFLTLGDRYHRMQDAQTLDNHHGKVVRLRKDGTVPPDNPLVRRPGARPEIWSWGHRNPQGATWGPDQRLWTVEHGPQGGDELNRPDAGQNHGWPVVTHGENYGGGPIGSGLSQQAGMEPPVHHWTPSIAPSGLAFVRGTRYGAWQGSLLVGSLKFRYLVRLELRGGRVVREEKWLQERQQRIRDVREGPDGWLYVLTDAAQGQLWRLLPV